MDAFGFESTSWRTLKIRIRDVLEMKQGHTTHFPQKIGVDMNIVYIIKVKMSLFFLDENMGSLQHVDYYNLEHVIYKFKSSMLSNDLFKTNLFGVCF